MENSRLWTKDFTIITLGTVVSMLGNACAGFALGLLVLDYTESVFLYSLTMVIYNLPKIVMPFLAGPYLDRFSRKKMIYGLDFLSAALYCFIWFSLRQGFFNYIFLLFMCVIIGSIDSIYQVAYDSFYPTLISPGNYRKAYSVSSMIYPLAAIMVPVAAYFYDNIGVAPLFLFNTFCFLIAAIFETQIRADEKHIKKVEHYDFKKYKEDFREGIGYIRGEQGLFVITAYFAVTMLFTGGAETLFLPYFKSVESLGVMRYTIVMGANVLGRLLGGLVHYRFRYPVGSKFNIALFVYVVSSAIAAVLLFLPMDLMFVMMLISGIICVTSYNIRISATQNYVPDNVRARFNGSFQMLCTLGGIIGQLTAGAIAEFLPVRGIVLVANCINIGAVYFLMYRGRESVKPIYNREV